MDIKEKRKLIEKYSDMIKIACEAYLDKCYAFVEQYYVLNLDTGEYVLREDKADNLNTKEAKMAMILVEDTKPYEKLRTKIINKDFELSATEIAMAGLVLQYSSLVLKNRVDVLNKTIEKEKFIISKLWENNLNVRFTKNDKIENI